MVPDRFSQGLLEPKAPTVKPNPNLNANRKLNDPVINR